MAQWMIGIDTGGTFTDLIAVERQTQELRLAKVPSVPGDPSVAVMNALSEVFEAGIRPQDVSMLVHGTTVATNALLEGKGVPTGLIITRGFRAVYEARGWSQPSGADLIDPYYRKPPLLVPQSLTEEVSERLDYAGEVVTPLDEADVRAAVARLKAKGVQSVAVCFLFSFLQPAHERRVGEILAEAAPEWRVSLSSQVLPVLREYPRLSTTVVDAYIGPTVADYLGRLTMRLGEAGVSTPQIFLMQSNGGLMRVTLGARHPNQTVLSGPAAGIVASVEIARVSGHPNVVTFDMGGTSADIGVVAGGRVRETDEGNIAGHDIGTPMLKVRTLGAGGGTIAWIGKDGLLKVGPQSAGAQPGPACYGRGGTEPTVTDANLVLGVLSGEAPLAGRLRLDAAKAEAAVRRVAEPLGLSVTEAAIGILRIVNTQMAVDLRLALQEEGQDPRRFALLSFGGAGGLHAAYLARAVGVPKVLVPPMPGLNCAIGLLQTAVRHSYRQSAVGRLGTTPVEQINAQFAALEEAALAEAAEEGFAPEAVTLRRSLDLRYPHQGYHLAVDCPARLEGDADKAALKRSFDERHRQIYGSAAEGEDAELVTYQVTSEMTVPRFRLPERPKAEGPATPKGRRRIFDADRGESVEAAVYDRTALGAGHTIAGPAIVEQFDATTLILSGQTATVDALGTLVIEAGAA